MSRRLTWEPRREGSTVRHGGVRPGGTNFEFNASSYFRSHKLTLKNVVLESAADFIAIAKELAGGKCRVYTADVSELGEIRSRVSIPADFEILDEQISREPLAPLVRQDDPHSFVIVPSLAGSPFKPACLTRI